MASITSTKDGVTWEKSGRSGSQGNCLEISANGDGTYSLRDSERPEVVINGVSKGSLSAFLGGVADGDFDHLV